MRNTLKYKKMRNSMRSKSTRSKSMRSKSMRSKSALSKRKTKRNGGWGFLDNINNKLKNVENSIHKEMGIESDEVRRQKEAMEEQAYIQKYGRKKPELQKNFDNMFKGMNSATKSVANLGSKPVAAHAPVPMPVASRAPAPVPMPVASRAPVPVPMPVASRAPVPVAVPVSSAPAQANAIQTRLDSVENKIRGLENFLGLKQVQ